ncbi:MAG: regulatory protein RecX [Armatimonadota bacterium]
MRHVDRSDATEEQAMQYAFRVLGYRARSVYELRQRMEQKGFSAQLTDRTLSELSRLGLLDDRDFAVSWASSRTGLGPARLKQELSRKGIDRDLAEFAIHTVLSTEDELTSAQRVATRALRSRTVPPDRAELLRLRRLLQRRGFSFDVINRVCARLNDHLSAEGDWLE